ncbi:MAG: metal ABC transporter permease, partial [Candidatus Paceibacteria bacterium]
MSQEALIFFTGIFVSAGAALLGIFVVLRKMALVSVALSHVALPGL